MFVKLFIPFTLIYWSSKKVWHKSCKQCAKKVMSNSPGLVDFVIWLVNFVWQVKFSGNSNYRRTAVNPAHQILFSGLVKMTLWLVHVNNSVPKWQAVNWLSLHPGKVSFFPGMQKLPSLAAKGKVLFLYPLQIMVQWLLHLTGNLLPRFRIRNGITILSFSLLPW